ncbi:MAG: SHOCT domain-containing protein [Candidatus Saccharibacteria bacterium]|nr:SHOCT domain-containing protein [Microbacteriaceae bacterium]
MLNNLTGWHVLVILGVLATMAIVVVAIIVVVIRLLRKNVRHPVTSSPDPVEQIRRLAQLRDEGLLSETEYEAKRAELMGRI